MLLFLIGLGILVVGYFTYGRLVEKILAPDDRPTPSVKSHDGVDFVRLPHWKNMLIQLLNIAGVGPVIGVILGIKFGVVAFLIIPIGNIIGGAVHDFVGGMMSLRHNGANLPTLIRMNTGKTFYWAFSIFMIFLLLLVVAVFINIPARLIDGFWPDSPFFWLITGLIFLYYIVATLFPVDKIIGAIYPLFGALLILGSFAIFSVLMYRVGNDPELLSESEEFQAGMLTAANNSPILPMLFVTIACGILSGFHATQSPIVARTMEHESQAKSSYYGMMVLEGIIGMIWAAAGLAIYNLFPELMRDNPTLVLSKITNYFLGSGMGTLTVISVVILAITSGDTAMRSLRLSLAEMFGIPQQKMRNRFGLCLPLIAIVTLLLWWSNQSVETFNQLWVYFAWGNQVLACCTLTAGTVWLIRQKKPGWITALPGAFMTFIVATYILWISPAHGGPLGRPKVGFGLELHTAYVLAIVFALVTTAWSIWHGRKLAKNGN
ncbi:MAG: hypothetical protein LBM70_10095 [Victivallales bacterium]|jgi:carbon starvation protein CstA|nr:hypothetical protein [Victivallales bacterium]